MTQFEIIMRTDTPELPSEIMNFEEVKAAIGEALKQYNTDVIVDAGSVKDAEKMRAHLRKVKEQIEAYRKDAKLAYLSKFESLETQCKELSLLIDAPIVAIDTQIKAFESAENSKKLLELNLFFSSIKPPEWLELDNVLNPKWKNKGMTLEKLKEEISTAVYKMQDDYTDLQNLYEKSAMWTAINQRFMECKNKSQTLVYAAQLERQHSEEQRRAEAIQKAREEQERAMDRPDCPTKFMSEETAQELPETAQNAHTDEEAQSAVTTPEKAQNAHSGDSDESEKILSGTFKVMCEKQKLIALVQFMKDNGIQYSVVK